MGGFKLFAKFHNIIYVQDQVAKQAIAEKEMEVDEDKPNVTCEEDDTSYEELFAAVVTAKDGERCISEMFKLLPSRKVCVIAVLFMMSVKSSNGCVPVFH